MPGQLELGTVAAPVMRPSAEVVAFAGVLELTSAQLDARVGEELEENPALERDETPVCLACGERLRGPHCWSCDRPGDVGSSRPAGPVAEQPGGGAAGLLADLRLRLPAQDATVAEYLVFNLGAHGLLEIEVSDVVAALGVAPERVWRALRALRELGPPGIAARSARECLLLQLDRWERDNEPRPLVRAVIEEHLADLAAGRVRRVAEATGHRVAEVRRAHAFIRDQLRPYPAIDLSPRGAVGPLLPDVAIRRDQASPARYSVDLLEPHRSRLRVRPLGPGGDGWVRDARLLISRIEQRWRTLRSVCEHLVTVQRGFLDHGPGQLVPLTRAAVARELGLHESTISRCVAGRYTVLPSRRIVPLAAFFPTAPRIHEALRRIAGDGHPRTDRELVARLGELGFRVTRRTVAKYRAKLGIPACGAR